MEIEKLPPGLWRETLEGCKAKIALAAELKDHHLDRALALTREAIEEGEVIEAWIRMTMLLEEVEHLARTGVRLEPFE